MSNESTNRYPPSVDKLLAYGDARNFRQWPHYLQLGLGAEHVPDLIRMATDDDLLRADSDSLEVWAPIHAWRALGQLRAEAAIEPLLTLLHRIDDNDDDWVGEELPRVYGMIGPAALPALAAYLADSAHDLFARIAAAHSLEQVSRLHSNARDECVSVLTRQLERFAENDPTINGFLISYLLDLNAVEAAPLIERAFKADRVDLTVAGDWEDTQVEFGLKPARETPRSNYLLESMPRLAPASGPVVSVVDKQETAHLQRLDRQADKKVKAKRKQAEKARKKNRKKRR